MSTANYLFVYGTLRPGTGHPMSVFLSLQAQCVGPAKCPGRLYDLGNFPGMLEAREPTDWVQGDLYRMADPERVLLELDLYEGCGPNDPQPWAFARSLATVTPQVGEPVQAWVYWHQRPVAEERRIVSGEYRQTGLHNFDWRAAK